MVWTIPVPDSDFYRMMFHASKKITPLGPVLRLAREERALSLADASGVLRLSVEKLEALENDTPLDPSLARLQAINYARFLGLDPTALRESLPPFPSLAPRNSQYVSNHSRWEGLPAIHSFLHSLWEALAPMGKIAIYLLLAATLLGAWGMIRQVSRIRSVPWVTTSYTLHDRPN